MKKIISFALILVMLASMLVITANAKENKPFGTVIEVPYTKTAPSMNEALPDASWGEKLIHVDKNSANAGITDYSFYKCDSGVRADQNLSMDVYARWTDDTLYLCFVSPETNPTGDALYMRGDGYQIDMIYGILDISHYTALLCDYESAKSLAYEYEFSYLLTFDVDDYSPYPYGAAENCKNVVLWYDEHSKQMVGKFETKFSTLGLNSKKEEAKDGDIISFSMLRQDARDGDETHYTGWLEWGDFFSLEKGWAAIGSYDEDTKQLYYNKESFNTATKTANSFKLVGKSGGNTPTPVTPAKEEPSSWAKAEVDKAIAAGLVPENLQKDYTKGISRENLAKILSKLLDKVYGKAPAKTDAKFKDTTDADVLKAANLGIINGYDAGNGTYNFKPANTLKRSEMSAIVNRVAKLCGKTTTGFDKEVKFVDTANHWCKSELGWPVHVGIVKGTSDTTFSPENTLTTEQTIMMIYRAYEALK